MPKNCKQIVADPTEKYRDAEIMRQKQKAAEERRQQEEAAKKAKK